MGFWKEEGVLDKQKGLGGGGGGGRLLFVIGVVVLRRHRFWIGRCSCL